MNQQQLQQASPSYSQTAQPSPSNITPPTAQMANLSISNQGTQPIGTAPALVVLPSTGQTGLRKTTSVRLGGSQLGTQHSFTIEEVTAFSEYINELLADDPDLKNILPIKSPDQFFRVASDGLLFCKLLNAIKPGTVNEKMICRKTTPNIYEKTQNHVLAIEGLKRLSPHEVVNIGPNDLLNGTKHLILAFVWQAIKCGLLSKLNVHYHPEMVALMDSNEDLNMFLNLTPDVNLLRWFNYHLHNAGSSRTVSNFTSDIQVRKYYSFRSIHFLKIISSQ
jgi:plastin-1